MNRFLNIIFFVIWSLNIQACSDVTEEDSLQNNKVINCKIDTIRKFHSGEITDLFSTIKIISHKGKDEFLMSYCYEDSIRILDVENLTLTSFYQGLGVKECREKSTFFYDFNDLITINHKTETIILLNNDKIIDSIDLNKTGILEKEDIYVDSYLPYCTQDFDLKPNEVLLRVKPLYEKIKYKKNESIPTVLIFNVISKEYEVIFHSNKRLDKKYGYLGDWYYFINSDSKIIISYRSDGEIDVYDRIQKRWERKTINSKYDDGFEYYLERGRKDTKDAKFLHSRLSPRYTSLVYNQHNRKYYRIFKKKLPKYDSDGLINSEENREVFLMIFNSDLELIDEVELPNIESFYALLPIKKGVLIRIMSMTEKLNGPVSNGINTNYLRIEHD